MEGLPALLARELLVFVGKGGVGKTTVSSAVALRCARAGRRTLLVTIDPAQRLEDALGVPVGHRVREVHGNLHAMMLDPEKVIEAYLREALPDQDPTRHPLYKYISNYMPGLNELIAIGKLIEFRREKDFDTIVIDTAPTGHALSFLTTPLKVRDLLSENLVLKWAVRGYGLYRTFAKGGKALQKLLLRKQKLPVAPDLDLEKLFETLSQRVGEIHELLRDPALTSLCLVTVPEKLAIEETIDLERYLVKELSIRPALLVVNKLSPGAWGGFDDAVRQFRLDADAQESVSKALAREDYPPQLLHGLLEAADFAARRRDMNLERVGELQHALPHVPKVWVPLQRGDVFGLDRLQELEEQLFDRFDRPLPTRGASA